MGFYFQVLSREDRATLLLIAAFYMAVGTLSGGAAFFFDADTVYAFDLFSLSPEETTKPASVAAEALLFLARWCGLMVAASLINATLKFPWLIFVLLSVGLLWGFGKSTVVVFQLSAITGLELLTILLGCGLATFLLYRKRPFWFRFLFDGSSLAIFGPEEYPTNSKKEAEEASTAAFSRFLRLRQLQEFRDDYLRMRRFLQSGWLLVCMFYLWAVFIAGVWALSLEPLTGYGRWGFGTFLVFLVAFAAIVVVAGHKKWLLLGSLFVPLAIFVALHGFAFKDGVAVRIQNETSATAQVVFTRSDNTARRVVRSIPPGRGIRYRTAEGLYPEAAKFVVEHGASQLLVTAADIRENAILLRDGEILLSDVPNLSLTREDSWLERKVISCFLLVFAGPGLLLGIGLLLAGFFERPAQ